jgi:hypothetical protein
MDSDNESIISINSVCDTMIKTKFVYLFQTNPNHHSILFKDSLSLDCALDNRTVVSVPSNVHNFVCYGKTLYQRCLGAEMIEEIDKQRARQSIELLSASFEHVPFETFWREAMRMSSIHPRIIEKLKHVIKLLFAKLQTHSWMHLFYNLFAREPDAEIYRLFGEIMPCILFLEMQNWILRKFIMFDYTDIHMKLDRTTVESYPEWTTPSSSPIKGGTRRRVHRIGSPETPTLACWLTRHRRIRRGVQGTRRKRRRNPV